MMIRRHSRARDAALGCIMAFLVLASSPATDAGAQASPDSSAVEPSIVVDGADWMGASSSERRAFLMGVGNMIAAELAYAKHRQLDPPAASDRIAAAVQDLKLGDIANVITAWYEANAAKRSFPVMGVIWQHIVKRQP